MDIIAQREQQQIKELTKDKQIPTFAPGDTLCVNVRVVEEKRTRTQAFEGVCIARSNKGINSNFTVRKISYGEGVERVFPLYSPNIESIDVVRRGDVRRAKLYYLRGRTGRAARIAEKRGIAKTAIEKGNGVEAKAPEKEPVKTAGDNSHEVEAKAPAKKPAKTSSDNGKEVEAKAPAKKTAKKPAAKTSES